MREFMAIARALADENRVRTLLALRKGELCVCQITELFGLAPSTISQHLSILTGAGLICSRKEGRWMYYRQPEKGTAVVRKALRWVEESLADATQITKDARALKRVLTLDASELCRRQCK